MIKCFNKAYWCKILKEFYNAFTNMKNTNMKKLITLFACAAVAAITYPHPLQKTVRATILHAASAELNGLK